MTVWLNPTTDYRYSLKKGMKGTDVAALQINFSNLNNDGDFGPLTEATVIDFQSKNNLTVDGIAGPTTQRRLFVKRVDKSEKEFGLPNNYLKSQAANESNFIVSAVSKHPLDSGLDVGALQMSTGNTLGNQTFYEYAYNIRESSYDVAADARELHDSFPVQPVASKYLDDLADGDIEKFKWQMCILNHNWPDAAEDIPRYGVIYEFDLGRDDEPAQWIIDVTNGRLETPRQWVYSYIEKSTVYLDL